MSKIGIFILMLLDMLCDGLIYVNHGLDAHTVFIGVLCIFCSVAMLAIIVTLVVYAVLIVIRVIKFEMTDWSAVALEEIREEEAKWTQSVKTETNEKEGA